MSAAAPQPVQLAPLSMIVAMTAERVIGRDNALPWHHSEDMRHFRRVTVGHALIMGRSTYESIGRPLPKRRMIVVSRNRALRIEGCEVVHSVPDAIGCARATDPEPIVIGGEQIYRAALPHATRIYLTEVPERVAGDSVFPELDPAQWVEVERRGDGELQFVTLERAVPAL